jgi:hypothetical protein
MFRKALVVTGSLIALVIIMRSRRVAATDVATLGNASTNVIRTLQGR